MIRRTLLLFLAAASCALAQEPPSPVPPSAVMIQDQTIGAGVVGMAIKAFPVQGAPYSATVTNESVQTLADGNRIVQNTTGATARDSQGRTRQDMPLPAIANLSAANAPHLVFIQDPVAQVSYTLNLSDKTAQKLPVPPPLPGGANTTISTGGAVGSFFLQAGPGPAAAGPMAPPPPLPAGAGPVFIQRSIVANDPSQMKTEELGTQTMEGLAVTGTRTTRTIPAGQIGNEQPISIVTEVWTSPDLKTIVYSKRTDPRTGEQTFQLTNIVRSEPDPSLFTVPADFKILDGPQNIFYRTTQ